MNLSVAMCASGSTRSSGDHRRQPDSLTLGQALAGFGTAAVDSDLTRTHPLGQLAVGHVGQRPAQPAVEADFVVGGADIDMLYRRFCRPSVRHTRINRISRRPANNAKIDTATEATI